MSNETKEILPPDPDAVLDRLAALVAKKLQDQQSAFTDAELTEQVLLEPWFLPRETAWAILRLLPVTHRNKSRLVYEDWGCFRCERKDLIHSSHGLCVKCYNIFQSRLKASIVRCVANDDRPTVAQLIAQLSVHVDSAKELLSGLENVASEPEMLPAAEQTEPHKKGC